MGTVEGVAASLDHVQGQRQVLRGIVVNGLRFPQQRGQAECHDDTEPDEEHEVPPRKALDGPMSEPRRRERPLADLWARAADYTEEEFVRAVGDHPD